VRGRLLLVAVLLIVAVPAQTHLFFLRGQQGASGTPTLRLAVIPAAPTTPSSDGTSGNIAALQGIWSDGSTFTGKYTPVAPNYDADTVTVSGSEVIIAGNGPGVASAGGTVQHYTMEAVQIDPTADLVTSSAPNGAPLATSAGVWSWGPAEAGRIIGSGGDAGGYVIYLNGSQPGSAAGTVLEVAHGGQLYVNTSSAGWYLWNGSGFTPSSPP
jgi:hypothetical protein